MGASIVTPIIIYVVNVDWFFLSHRLPIALAAQRHGYQVHVATGLTDRLVELQRHGFVVHPLSLVRAGIGPMDAWRVSVELWRIFRTVRPDIVHLVTIKPVLLGGLAARLVGVRSVVAAVSGLGHVFVSRGKRAAVLRGLVGATYRAVFGQANVVVIFQNHDDLRQLSEIAHLPAERTIVICGSGVDLTEFVPLPLPLGEPVVLLAARLLEEKGVREFVRAGMLLRNRRRAARFVLVGNVDPANPTSLTQAEVDAWVRSGAVEWWGQRSDMPQVLALARLVVLPSYREGMPKVLLEAAASGRAVVTTDVPGCRDAIDPGLTGVLVPARDADALADAIEDLLRDRPRCAAMGVAGRALAEREFDVRNVVAEHLRIYHTAMQPRDGLSEAT